MTLAAVARHCDPDELENLAAGARRGASWRRRWARRVSGLRADQRRAIAGLRARLRNLASSEFARAWLDPAAPRRPTAFDLREAIERREVVYFRFDTDRTGNVGRAIAQMALLDLGAAASALMGEGVGTFVAIDEFGALEAPALDRLYARGRAAGFSVAVGTQTLADLRAAGPAVRERIGATVSAIVCHRIGEQADAEWVAELIGAVPTWQTTIRTDGFGAADRGGHPHPRLPLRGQPLRAAAPRPRRGLRRPPRPRRGAARARAPASCRPGSGSRSALRVPPPIDSPSNRTGPTERRGRSSSR